MLIITQDLDISNAKNKQLIQYDMIWHFVNEV